MDALRVRGWGFLGMGLSPSPSATWAIALLKKGFFFPMLPKSVGIWSQKSVMCQLCQAATPHGQDPPLWVQSIAAVHVHQG